MDIVKITKELYIIILAVFLRYFKMVETQEPKQIESAHSKITDEDDTVKKFKQAFEYAKKLSKQGIEENKDKNLIKAWWTKVGKKSYTEKTPWCTLGILIPLMKYDLINHENIPNKIGLAREYVNNVPKGFKFVKPKDLVVGDIAVKWRGTPASGGGKNGWMGHIGWFDGLTPDGNSYFSVGGNQDNQFNRKKYSRAKLLGGIRIIGSHVDTIDDQGGVDMSVDTNYISERFRQRAIDMAQIFLLAKETRNLNDIKFAYIKIKKYEHIYIKLERSFGVPWQAIAAIHYLESSVRFDRHIHNGDPLSARTVRVPAGRPVKPPKNGFEYTFEESMADALTVLKKKPKTWSLPNLMHYIESYNGFGYFYKGLNSPYLVGGSQFQQAGKYVADGKFDTSAMTKRAGAIVLMKKLGYEPI